MLGYKIAETGKFYSVKVIDEQDYEVWENKEAEVLCELKNKVFTEAELLFEPREYVSDHIKIIKVSQEEFEKIIFKSEEYLNSLLCEMEEDEMYVLRIYDGKINELGYQENVVHTYKIEAEKTYLIDYNTGAGNAQITGSLDKAKKNAIDGMAYTQKNVDICLISGNDVYVVSTSRWYGTEPSEEDDVLCKFGSSGFYEDWVDA
ncbi:MAG: hypothetical protein RSA79_00155 [Oscillospiraceae bacterium]